MFYLSLCVIQPDNKSGLEAIDFCRKWGFQESTYWSGHGYRDGHFNIRVVVSEDFARANFPYTESSVEVAIPLEMLTKEEVKEKEGGHSGVFLQKGMSEARACELFHAVERQKLLARIKELEKELQSMREDS